MVEPGIVIPHVVNNAGKMASGFVVPLCKKWPIVKEEYIRWKNVGYCLTPMSMPYALGCTQHINVENDVYVANMIAQTLYDRPRPLRYNKLCDCMEHVATFAKAKRLSILAPKFGSELAGGKWEFVEDLIYDIWIEKRISVTIVEYSK